MPYRTPGEVKDYPDEKDRPQSTLRWWDDDEDLAAGRRHEKIWEQIRAIEDQDFVERERQMRQAYLYDPTARLLGPDARIEMPPGAGQAFSPTTTNIVTSCVDTSDARLASHLVKPVPSARGAEWSAQRKARSMGMFLDADWWRAKLYDEAPRSVKDALIVDMGCLKVFPRKTKSGWRVHGERTLIDELRWDDEECRTSGPRQLFQLKWVNADVLLADIRRWIKSGAAKVDIKEARDAVEKAVEKAKQSSSALGRGPASDQILVGEAWHLPSGADENDGMHGMCIEGMDLFFKPYKREWFPFCFFRFNERLTGFRGRSLVTDLVGTQYRINKLNRFIEKCQDLIAVPRIFVRPGDAHLKAVMNDNVGQVIETKHGKPDFMTPPAVAADIYMHRRDLKDEAYEISGVSQPAAQGVKSPGLESGEAIREARDEAQGRFARAEQRQERFYIDIATMWIEVQREISTELEPEKDHEVTYRQNRRSTILKFKDVDVDLDGITMRAASIASMTPAARKQLLLEWAQSGIIDGDTYKKWSAYNDPDLESEMSMVGAAMEDVDGWVEDLRDYGDGKLDEFPSPDGDMHLSLAVRRAQQAKRRDKREGAPQEVLDAIGHGILQAKALLDKAMAEAQAEQARQAAGQQMQPPDSPRPTPGIPSDAMQYGPH